MHGLDHDGNLIRQPESDYSQNGGIGFELKLQRHIGI
jgi:hypothetical protein